LKKATKKEILEIKEIFLERYKDAKTELKYKNEYELLVSIILSAQCTDKRVNIITPALFEKFPSTFELSIASFEEVSNLISSCSFFQNKAKHLINMAIKVQNEFDGTIPKTQKELISLNGVGQKTANVFLIESKNEDLMAVDTHVFRVSHRLGLSSASRVEETEVDLVKAFKSDLNQLHQAMVLFGRYICKANSPSCDKCFMPHLCKSRDRFAVNSKKPKLNI
jgi:endonuclease-3